MTINVGKLVDKSITEDELYALWDMREVVFLYYGDTKRLPKTIDDLLEHVIESAMDFVSKNQSIDKSVSNMVLDKYRSLPNRLDSLELISAKDGQGWCKIRFIGNIDGELHEYDPTTANYPTNIE